MECTWPRTEKRQTIAHAHTILSPVVSVNPLPHCVPPTYIEGGSFGYMCPLHGGNTYVLLKTPVCAPNTHTRRGASQTQPVVNPRTLSRPRGLDSELPRRAYYYCITAVVGPTLTYALPA